MAFLFSAEVELFLVAETVGQVPRCCKWNIPEQSQLSKRGALQVLISSSNLISIAAICLHFLEEGLTEELAVIFSVT